MIDVLAYMRLLKDKRDTYIKGLNATPASSFEQYQHRLGIIKGIQEALTELQTLMKVKDDDTTDDNEEYVSGRRF